MLVTESVPTIFAGHCTRRDTEWRMELVVRAIKQQHTAHANSA